MAFRHRCWYKYINIWHEPWLHKHGRYRYVTSPVVSGLENLTVNAIVHNQNNAWNLDILNQIFSPAILNQIFSPADINEILHTPTPSFKSEDTCIWAETKDGLYSVKGAYHMIMNNFVNQETWCVNGEWKILWDMKIPPRVKLMIWRSCRGCLCTRNNLRGRGVQCPIICPLCETSVETTSHILLTCPVNSECWKAVKMDTKMLQCLDSADSFGQFYESAGWSSTSKSFYAYLEFVEKKKWQGVGQQILHEPICGASIWYFLPSMDQSTRK